MTRTRSDQAQDSGAPRAARQQVGSRLAQDGQDVARAERRRARSPRRRRRRGGRRAGRGSEGRCPSSAAWSTCHAVAVLAGARSPAGGSSGPVRSAKQNVTPVGRDADGPDAWAGRGPILRARPEQAVGRLEGPERRDAVEALQQGAPCPRAASGTAGRGRSGRPVEPVRRSDADAGRAGRGRRRPANRDRGRPARGDGSGWPVADRACRRAAGPRRAPGAGGQARGCQPARSWSGSTKRVPPPHVATEVERGEDVQSAPSPRRVVRDAPQGVARAHRVGRARTAARGRRTRRRSQRAGSRLGRPQWRRRACWRPRRRRQREREHPASSRRARRARCVPATRSSTDEPVAGRPTSPLPRRYTATERTSWAQQAAQATQAASSQHAQRIAGQGSPRVPEPSRQRVADDEHEHGRHGGEGEESGEAAPATSRTRRPDRSARAC